MGFKFHIINFKVYLSANISGAHLNPAISLMFWIQGDMGFIRMLVYWVAQYLGGIIGSLVSFLGHYGNHICSAFQSSTLSF